VTESQTWQTSWGRSISGVYAMSEPASWGFAMLRGWLPGFGPHWSGSTYLRRLLDRQPAVVGSMSREPVDGAGTGVVQVDCVQQCWLLVMGSSPDRFSGAGVHVQGLSKAH